MENFTVKNPALAKLKEVRKALRAMDLQKTGWNDFSKYHYFDLQDFLPQGLDLLDAQNLVPKVDYHTDHATLTITDLESGDAVVFHSPMSEANLKGMHPVQNLGAVETYLRRYLYITAFEIMEPSATDQAPIQEEKGKAKAQGNAKELPLYTEAQFKKNVGTWVKAILVDKTNTKDQIIKQIMQKYAWPAEFTEKLDLAIEKGKERLAEGGE